MNCTHSSGLIFTAYRLMDINEKESMDITVITLHLPNCKETPMMLVDWYFGEYDLKLTEYHVEKWLEDKNIEELLELQDMIE